MLRKRPADAIRQYCVDVPTQIASSRPNRLDLRYRLNGPDKKIAHAKVGYFFDAGGEDGNRTRLNGFAGRID